MKKQSPSTLYKLVTSRQRVIRLKHKTSWSFPYDEVVEERINNEQYNINEKLSLTAYILLFRVTIILLDLNDYVLTHKYTLGKSHLSCIMC